MPIYEKCYPGQMKQGRLPQKESQQLRQSLVQKARNLKQKMYQQTNYYDYSIDHLMSQTLKEIKKHKQEFKEKEQNIIQDEQSEQIRQKKQSLKTQLLQNLQKCKNRYKKHISIIKNQRNRVYTDVKDQSPKGVQNVEDMLITAKNRFKQQHRQKRNHSEIINVNSTKTEDKKKSQNNTHQVIDHRKTPKLYKNLIRINEDLTYILEDPSAFPKLNEEEMREIADYKNNHREVFGMISPMTSKKQIFLLSNPSKKLYYSPYHRFPTQIRQNMNNARIETLISERSAFIPIGKIIRSQRKKLEISNSKMDDGMGVKGQNITGTNKRLSTQIVKEISEIEQQNEEKKSTLEKESEDSLGSNQLLTKTTPKSLEKKPNRSKFLTQSLNLQSDKMSRLKAQKIITESILFDNIKGTRIATEFMPFLNSPCVEENPHKNQQNQDQKQIKIDEEITGKFPLSDSKALDGVKKDSILLKSTVYNNSLKFNGFNKVNIKNKLRYEVDVARDSNLEIVADYKKKLSKSINLDVRGNNLKLLSSLKLEKHHKHKGSDFSTFSIQK